jgi:hypothetical protein
MKEDKARPGETPEQLVEAAKKCMQENEFDYYVAEYRSSLLVWFSDDKIIGELRGKRSELKTIEMSLTGQYLRKLVMPDFINIRMVSKKIYGVLSPLKIKGTQLIPATIYNPGNNKTYEGYYYLHIYNRLECFDNKKSIYGSELELGLTSVKRLVLDEEKLSKIPLDERLVFTPFSESSYSLDGMFFHSLFHKSIADKITASGPKGIRFVNVKNYKYRER